MGANTGAETDRTVAEALKMPPAWVTALRIEIFGDTGSNDELDAVKKELTDQVVDASRRSADAMALAEAYEEMGKKYRALLARIERAELNTGVRK